MFFSKRMTYRKQLEVNGYVVIPCLQTSAKGGTLRKDMREALSEMPEFIDPKAMLENKVRFVQGGFAAMGNPSSFHHKFVRDIRRAAHQCVLKHVFGDILADFPNLKFEQVIDRLMFRRPDQRPGKESWHRDEAKNALEEDTVYGGWINLDNYDQFFSGCPGTHRKVSGNKGFARIKNTAEFDSLRQKIRIPPGHIFIFYERMVHEVRPSPKKEDQHRLFLGWRTTYSDKPLFPDLRKRLALLKPMQIKSGQEAAVWPQLYWTNWRPRLQAWSQSHVKPEYRTQATVKSGNDKGKTYDVAQRYMEPLMRADCCPPYEEEEIALYEPHRPAQRGDKKRGREGSASNPVDLTMSRLKF